MIEINRDEVGARVTALRADGDAPAGALEDPTRITPPMSVVKAGNGWG
ncbi:MAG: hypothetical protein ACRDQG_09445 [Pseudonocardiaceae bacterium]